MQHFVSCKAKNERGIAIKYLKMYVALQFKPQKST